MNALAIHLYLTIRYINLSFNHFGNFYRIIDYSNNQKTQRGCDYPELCDKTLLEIF